MDVKATDDSTEYYKVYEEYSKTLRTWFVAYGIGAPVLFISNDTAAKAFKNVGDIKIAVFLFLLGVAIQVALALINKVAMWTLYFGEKSPEFKKTFRYKSFNWLSSQFRIDVVADIATMVLFAYATWQIIVQILNMHP